LVLITSKGILMRTRVAEIRETGRNAAGVRLIKLDEGDALVAMAKVDTEEAPTPVAGSTDPAAPADAGESAESPGDAEPPATDPGPSPEPTGE
jgi:DNA gyrase subunit A